MDETSFALGLSTSTFRVVRYSDRNKQSYKRAVGNRDWATVIETVSVGSRTVLPYVLLKGKQFDKAWFDFLEALPESNSMRYGLIAPSENGWSSTEHAKQWIEHFNKASWPLIDSRP